MTETTDDLSELRTEIDRIDDEIAALVAERVRTAERVATVKSREGKDLVDTDREATVEAHYEALFDDDGLPSHRGGDLAAFLIDLSLERERALESE